MLMTRALHCRFHRAAFRMTTHNDVRYLQTQYGVLDRTRFGEVADRYTFVSRRRNQIADITHDKKVARVGRSQQSGTTRLSEHVTISVSGDCASANSRNRSACLSKCCSRNSTIPEINLCMIGPIAGGRRKRGVFEMSFFFEKGR
jgi:hypothetical protein